MKKYLITGMVILLGLLTACNLQTIGSDKYYVQVEDNGKKYTEQNYTRYEYTLKGFDADGERKELTFTAKDQLKEDAYLRVYYKKDEVITYEEVQSEDMPKRALQLLEKVNNP